MTGSSRVPAGFSYESGSNPDFLSVDQLRDLIFPGRNLTAAHDSPLALAA
jgi:hypothetical protein